MYLYSLASNLTLHYSKTQNNINVVYLKVLQNEAFVTV